MRRKMSSPNGGGYNNQRSNNNNRPRYANNGGGGDNRGSNNGGGGRPRKNYGALREKYLTNARDALASGDRVLAENYFQHADHCYRMMVEEGARNPTPQHAQPQPQSQQNPDDNANESAQEEPAGEAEESTNVLPAFLTGTAFPPMAQETAKEPVVAQNWEE